MSSTATVADCPPRFATRRRPERNSYGFRAAKICRALGFDPFPHQQQIWDTALEVDSRGVPYYREVVVVMPRQCGKTLTTLCVELDRALNWRSQWVPQGGEKILYAAQDQERAGKVLIREQLPLVEASVLDQTLDQTWRKAGGHRIQFKTGSNIESVSSNANGCRGLTKIGLGVCDELYAADSDDLVASFTPAMAHRPDAQLWFLSNAGTETSLLLAEKVAQGRKAVRDDDDGGICYFEWSAPDSADLDDEQQWYDAIPMLAYGAVSVEVIRAARRSMTDNSFAREWLNITRGTQDRVISADLWMAVQDDDAQAVAPVTLALDVSVDRHTAALAVVGGGVVEMPNQTYELVGVKALAIRLAHELRATVVVDQGGPAGSFADELEAAGVTVKKLQTASVAAASGQFYDAVRLRELTVRTNPELSHSVATSQKKFLTDRWLWNRSQNGSPLIAASLAYHVSKLPPDKPEYGWLSFRADR